MKNTTVKSPTYTHGGNSGKTDRANEIKSWDNRIAIKLASDEGMEISDEHLKVLHFLRNFYLDNGWPKKTHELSQILDKTFEQQGGNQYLYRLFPDGPVTQGTRLAGLPALTNSTDESFGSSH